MVKRKRDEPKLGESLEKWEKSLTRGIKAAKGFERQRLSKRIRDADPDKVVRLEREIAVLKSLDLHQAAHQHLCSSLLKIKGIAESPNLPDTIKPVPKPNLSEEEHIALHNVSSALYNRKQVKDVIEEAIMGVCIALRVPMPEKKGKGKGKKNEKQEQEQQTDNIEPKPIKVLDKESRSKKLETPLSCGESSGESWDGISSHDDSDDSEAEQKSFSRFEGMLGGSSDDDGSEDGGSDEEDWQNSRARSIRGPSDHFSGSSAEEDEDSHDELKGEDLEEEALLPPAKKSRAKSLKAASAAASGNSTFLPSLMGGYISGSESEASDIEDFAPKKNRRGQRARQAIWEKKFKEQARHIQLQKQKSSRDDGWDLKRGAVGEEDSGPWKKGISKPFERPRAAPEGVHPQRHGNFAREAREAREVINNAHEARSKPAPKPAGPKRDDTGPLHPSWEAARKAKETSQKIAFEGRKTVFSD